MSNAANVSSENQPRKGVFIQTFGCQMNEYDTQKLLKLLEPGFAPVASPAEAHLVLINTCSVRDKPEQKLYSWLGEMRDLKRRRPEMMIGVGGCVAQQEGDQIIKRAPVVDFVFGTHNLSLVPSLIELRRNGAPPQVAVNYREEWEDLPIGFSEHGSQNRVAAFISISRGCNKNCAFCIVPRTRGPEVSRDPQEILRETRIALRRGAREVILLGQTVNSYGLDLQPRMRFSQLIEMLGAEAQLERIRFTSPHPQEVRADFFEVLRTNPKVCRHIHMPLQSGSDHILKAMNRNYRQKRYMEIISGLRAAAPDIAITTDIIVGFPGESEEDFAQTMQVLEQVRYHNVYSFAYSARPGTPAAEMPNQIADDIKFERLQRLQARQNQITAELLKDYIGAELEVLLDSYSVHDDTCLHGRTSQNVSLNLTARYDHLKPGALVLARVEQAARFTLKGSVVRVLRES